MDFRGAIVAERFAGVFQYPNTFGMMMGGWLGFLCFIGVFGYFFWHILKNFRVTNENTLYLAVMITSLAILLHSFLDFNFSYSTVWFLLIWLMIIGTSLKEESKQKPGLVSMPSIGFSSSLFIVGLACFFTIRFMIGEQQFLVFKDANSYQLKKQAVVNAIAMDPYNAVYRLNLIGLEFSHFKRTHDESSKQVVLHELENLITLEGKNSEHYLKAGNYAKSLGEFDLALSYYDDGLKLDHYHTKLYEKSIELKLQLLNRAQYQSNFNKLLHSAIIDYETNVKWWVFFNKNAPKEAERFNSRKFHVDDQSHLMAIELYMKKNDYKNTLKAANRLTNNTIQKRRALAQIILIMKKNGYRKQANELEEKYEKELPNFVETLMSLRDDNARKIGTH